MKRCGLASQTRGRRRVFKMDRNKNKNIFYELTDREPQVLLSFLQYKATSYIRQTKRFKHKLTVKFYFVVILIVCLSLKDLIVLSCVCVFFFSFSLFLSFLFLFYVSFRKQKSLENFFFILFIFIFSYGCQEIEMLRWDGEMVRRVNILRKRERASLVYLFRRKK